MNRKRLTGLIAFLAVVGLLASQAPIIIEELTGADCRTGYLTALARLQAEAEAGMSMPPTEQLTSLAGASARYVETVRGLPCRGELEAGKAAIIAAGERFTAVLNQYLAGLTGVGEVYAAAEELGNANKAFRQAVDE